MMKAIRIGTRNSPLALWQAREVARNLQNQNYTTDIIPIVSSGDKNLNQPLYSLGITGVFTKDLDVALLNDEIDIAVHSLKDVPTQLPNNIEISAVLERDFPQDVLVRNSKAVGKELHELKIATSSLRRRAFWKREFLQAEFCDIRGNVQTRLAKLEEGLADATIFSLAGIKRMDMHIDYEYLPMMLPAPSQGVIAVASRIDDAKTKKVVETMNDHRTQICIDVERNFLKTLEGGCTAPIGAFAELINGEVRFKGRLCSLDGKEMIEVEEVFQWNPNDNFGEMIAHNVLNQGGKEMMEVIKGQL